MIPKVSCSICGYDKHLGSLHIHHIDNDHFNDNIDNLVVLCANCHMELHQKNNIKKARSKKNPPSIKRNEQIVDISEKEVLREENDMLKNELCQLKQSILKKDAFFHAFLKELPEHMEGFFYKNQRVVNELFEKMYMDNYK